MKTIDLGKTSGTGSPEVKSPTDSKKPYYPSVYITDIDGADDLPTGEFEFHAKGKVVSKSTRESADGKKTTSIEIEVHKITPDVSSIKKVKKEAVDALDETFGAIEKKKQESAEEEANEEEIGMDNDAEEAEETD